MPEEEEVKKPRKRTPTQYWVMRKLSAAQAAELPGADEITVYLPQLAVKDTVAGLSAIKGQGKEAEVYAVANITRDDVRITVEQKRSVKLT